MDVTNRKVRYGPMQHVMNHDSMAMVKMNVFHWHITDDQSFPFISTTCSELSEGDYRQFKSIYGEEDVEKLLHYARQRGIRVIPEFDIPGR
ncbi:unnamed protein product [Trichobilharzia regenti]|nr:unnamed protein product [Trichobilharzia regenti]